MWRNELFKTLYFGAQRTALALSSRLFKCERIKRAVESGDIKRILVVREALIGDAVVLITLLKALSSSFDVFVLPSALNAFVFRHFTPNIPHVNWHTSERFDVVVDGTPHRLLNIKTRFPHAYVIGFSKLLLTPLYDCACLPASLLARQRGFEHGHVTLAFSSLLKRVGIVVDEEQLYEPRLERAQRVFILLSAKPGRNLSPQQWLDVVNAFASFTHVTVADDPHQRILSVIRSRLPSNVEVLEPMSLEQLRAHTKHHFVIGVDGGGHHFLSFGRPSLTIYTTGFENMWHPLVPGPWRTAVFGDVVVRFSLTSVPKFVVYKDVRCKPCFVKCGLKRCFSFSRSVWKAVARLVERNVFK
jgi:hypothetical protein